VWPVLFSDQICLFGIPELSTEDLSSSATIVLMLNGLPTYSLLSPDYNAIEECWRQGKDDLVASKYYSKFHNLKSAIANYYRTKHFKLDITKYLFRDAS
jgi:hypothetical protein